ncbi:hypothetical protein LIER_07604 [Lithospermum erythrorhizon]|uniref:Nuclear pore complex protein NUP214 n=1 Tax=Lithospermum erythrorhizon TaxID=34254 RepID=A0AAV3P8W8_LITER
MCSSLIEVDEEIEGEQIGSRNYRFSRIGEAVSIKHPSDSQFDLDSPPTRPIAISNRFRLLFVAHSQGFCVARIKEVKELAAKLKNDDVKDKERQPSIQELSIVDVPAGKVSILALSRDDSMLAATVDHHIHFYAVSSLLHKEQKPSYSVSADDSSYITDMRWAQLSVKEYVVLLHNGKLYQGCGQSPLKDIMDSVDAVEWSEQGDSVAVARKNILSILSSQLKEKRSFSLSFKSVIGDSDANSVIKVNCIRWVRPDCIMVGCLQLNDEGEEENYLVQVITSKGGCIDDASSIPIVLSFYDIFPDYQVDVVPGASGPHLLLQYFDSQQLAFVANRKNLTQHVILFGWGLSGKMNDAAAIEILNDSWNPRIEPQGNEDDNIILGLSIHNIFENDNVTYLLGDVETEVPPCCNLLCLTIDGKISVFDFASAAEASNSVEISDLSHEEYGAPLKVSASDRSAEVSSTVWDKKEADTSARVGTHISSGKGLLNTEVAEAAIPDQFSALFNQGKEKSLQYDQSPKGYQERTSTQTTQTHDRDTHQTNYAGLQLKSAKQASLQNFNLVNLEPDAQGLSKSNIQTISEAEPSTGFSTRDVFKDGTNPDTAKMLQIGHTAKPPNNLFTTDVRSGSLFSTPSAIASPHQDLSNLKKYASPLVNSSGRISLSGAVNIQSSVAFNSTQVPAPQNFDTGKFSFNPQKKFSNPSSTQVQSLEANSLKQYQDIEEIVEKMDSLLENIEGKGGFVDASVAFQESSVEALEEKIFVVSRRCREWKVTLDEQISEMQDLLDKTLQVFSRKVYMEGIFKQARDTRYWDLWNRQRLSSELELKRRHIVEANKACESIFALSILVSFYLYLDSIGSFNQELTNQLIELERHFNILELNRFGDGGGLQMDRRTSQKWHGQSRHIQSLQSLYSTTEAQLIAAEQLSENLSKQMSVLNIESPAKAHTIKKELFDTIGLSYDASSFSSPGKEKISATPLNKKLLSSASVATIERTRRDHNSLAKTHEPETARRRRDSLDRNWVSVAPPRTTVKRIVLHEDQDGLHGNRSPFPLDRQHISNPLSRGMMDTPPKSSSFSQNQLKSKGIFDIQDQFSNQSPSNGLTERGNRVPNTMTSEVSSHTALLSTASAGQSRPETAGWTNEKLGHAFPTKSTGSFILGEHKPVQQFGQNPHEAQFSSSRFPVQPLFGTKTGMENSDNKTSFSYAEGSDLSGQNSSFPAISPSNVPSFPASSVQSDSKISWKLSDGASTKQSLHVEPTSSYSPSLLQGLNSSSLTTTNFSPAHLASSPKQSESALFGELIPTSKASVAADQSTAECQPLVSSPLTFPTTFSFLTPKTSTVVSPTSVGQPTDMLSSKSKFIPEAKSSIASEPSPSDSSKSERIDTLETPPASGSLRTVENSSDVSEPQKDEVSATQASSANAWGNGFKTITATQQSEVIPDIAGADKVSDLSAAVMQQSTSIKSSSDINLGGTVNPSSDMLSNDKAETPENVGIPFSKVSANSGIINSSVNAISSVVTQEDEMEEEAPETSETTELSLGFLGGFGIGSTPKSDLAKPNPFGLQMTNAATPTSSIFPMPSSGELFRPPSFSFTTLQPAQPSQSTDFGAFSGGFNGGAAGQSATASGFGKPAQIGFGQQALGSVLGSFGQSRQLGAGLPGTGIASPGGFPSNSSGGFGSGFGGVSSTTGGFSNLASGVGGFAAAATAPGGFAAAASAPGGFAAAASAPGGFAAAASAPGGFAAAATGAGFGSSTNGAAFPGGFGAFGGQQGGGVFSSPGTGRPPSELFTQMRK